MWFNRGPGPFSWMPNVRPPMMGQPNLPGPPRPPGPMGPWNPFNKVPSVPQMWTQEPPMPMNLPNLPQGGMANQRLPPMPNAPNFHLHSAPLKPEINPVKVQQQQQSNANRSPQKTQQGNKKDSSVQKSMAFVPLQAQKKSRHTSAKQAAGESNQSNKKANQSKEQSEKLKEQPVVQVSVKIKYCHVIYKQQNV